MTTTSSGSTSFFINPIALNTILADVAIIVPEFSSVVSSYRLLVGAAEEISRTPGTSPEIRQKAVARFDRTGDIIDILIDLLFCKVAFSAQFLEITCAPIDLLRALLTCLTDDDTLSSCTPLLTATASQPVLQNLVRQFLDKLNEQARQAPSALTGPQQDGRPNPDE